MNKQILKKLSAIALAVAMLQGVAITSAISYSAVETEQVEASFEMYQKIPNGVTVRYDYDLHEFIETEFIQSGDYIYYVTDDGKGAVIAGEQRVNGYCTYGGGYDIGVKSGYRGNDEEVVIPSELDGLPVVKLGEYVFWGKKENIYSISIPSTVKVIEEGAFDSIHTTVKIQLSEGVKEILSSAFLGLNANEKFKDESRKLVIPSSVKKLSNSAFNRMSFSALVFPKNSQLNRNAKYDYKSVDGISRQIIFQYVDDKVDVLVPDDFDITSILLRNDSYIYYTEKNQTLVKYVKNASKNDLAERTFVKLELKDQNVDLEQDEEYELKSNLHQKCLIDSCTWRSSNTSVATVDENGKVTAVGVGTATITMTTENEMQASCTVNVLKGELKITKSELKIGLDQKYKLALNKADVKGTWSSSDTSVATVNKSGNVTAVGVGTATITFTSEEGEKATCLINVAEGKVSDLGFIPASRPIRGVGRKYSITDNSIRVSGFTWKSSDTKVVTVDKYGIITTVGVGKANVTVTDKFGNKFTCKVKVGI